ncbi:hypothetical protein [Marinoscillum sp.]|uniref:hypothetical protein n=1 Tax=Marinoscillum sp. TaxID=2024838 RepID=UPI003BAB5F51
MENSWYSFDISPLWVVLALVAALAVSLLLYSRKKMPWSKSMNVLLGFLRFSAIFLTILLLINPLVELNQNSTNEPIIVLALDNSESVTLRESGTSLPAYNQWLKNTKTSLLDDYEVAVEGLSSDTISATDKTTNLSRLLKSLETKYEEANVGAVILASDGIVNNGQSPDYLNYKFPIYTVGLGDTIPPKDVVIQNVRNNKVAYQGNKFPIMVQLYQKGFQDQSLEVKLLENGQQIANQSISLTQATHQVDFLIEAKNAGLRRFTIQLNQLDDESSYENNQTDVYVDVIEGKDKILLLAPAPHPDLRAIRSVLEETENYETTLYIPGINEAPKEDKFDLIIEHQAFSGRKYKEFQSAGRWYIMGNQSQIRRLPEAISFLSIDMKGNQRDQVRGSYNKAFTKFKLNDELISRSANYPPIEAPFGEYTVQGPTEVLLYQQVGSITTGRPLMIFSDNGSSKTALLTGEGIWQWKLQEAGQHEESRLFDELVLKTVQYLSIKVNKDRFVVKPRESNYQIGDRVIIDTEVYNEIYERTYGNTINLTITDQSGNINTYELVDNPANSSFAIGSMEPGVYTFRATTTLAGKTFTEQGSFAVRNIQLEGINLTADHNMLRRLSQQSGGAYYPIEETDALLQQLENQDFPSVISTEKNSFPLIQSLWIVLLIFILLTIEWFLRKYLGAY